MEVVFQVSEERNALTLFSSMSMFPEPVVPLAQNVNQPSKNS